MNRALSVCLRAALLSLALAVPAAAQEYVQTAGTTPYSAIAAGDGTTLFTDSDDGFAAIDLPFVFRFYGRSYGPGQTSTSLWVSVNGAVALAGRDTATGQLWPLPGTNMTVPSTQTPQAIIAPLWDDFVASPAASGGGSRVACTVEGSAGSRVLVIDWHNVQLFAQRGASDPTYSFSLRLSEGTDRLEFRYGPRTGNIGTSPLSATVGVENALGTQGMAFFACSPSCTNTQVPADSGNIYLPNTMPALSLSVAVDGSGGSGPSVVTRIANQGNSGGTVPYVLHLSKDTVLDASDPIVYTSAPITIGARPAQVSERVVLTLDPAVLGARYLIGVVDPDQTLPTLDRGPNTGVSPPFIAGPDLKVTAVSPPSAIGGGHIVVTANATNGGTSDGAAARLRVMLSGPKLRTPRELLRTSPVSVPALQTVQQSLDVPIPVDVLAGSYNLTVEIDPDKAVAEGDESNNTCDPIDLEVAGPDIGVSEVRLGSSNAYQGLTFPLRVSLQNLGPAAATNFTVGVYISTNDSVTLYDRKLYGSSPMSLEPLAGSGGLLPRTLLFAVPVPADLAPGTYHIGVIADPSRTVPESERANNTRLADTLLQVFAPAPDLTVTDAHVQSTAAAGETARISGLSANLGSAAAEFGYSVVISSNAIVSAKDAVLATGRISLAPRAQQVLAFDVPLPSTLPPGTYTVGLVVDGDGQVAESDETNNTASAGTLTVGPPGLIVTTDTLPDAVIATAYEVRLAATGGSGRYTWRVAAGALPSGLTLDATGRISGTPAAGGTSSVVVEVKSESITNLASFALLVRSRAASLGLIDDRMPPARIGRAYSASIGAIGGSPPYHFTVTSGTLPKGLSLAADGTLSGAPTVTGSASMTVTLDDAAGSHVTGPLHLDVLDANALAIGTTRLRDTQTGKAYAQTLNVQGGVTPYSASLMNGALPQGLALTNDPQGQPAIIGAPSQAGTWGFTIVVSDAAGSLTLGTFTLTVTAKSITFTTSTLAAATPGAAYQDAIGTNARPPATITLASGELPPGLVLDAAGTISGFVPADAPRRLYPFSVLVRDSTGGEALGAFAIDIPLPQGHLPAEGGCASAGGFGLLAPIMLVLTLLRRRRAMLTALLVAIPSVALADYRVTRTAQTFQPISGGFQIFDSSAGTTPKATALPIPFQFEFWGTHQNSVTVTTVGLLTFGGVTVSADNAAVPSGGSPTSFIAPFWDYFVVSPSVPTGTSTIKWAIEGTAPNRALVVEWRNVQRYGYGGTTFPAYSFQVRLYEGSNDFTIDYDSVSALGIPVITATMGVQGPGPYDGFDLSDKACSPGCPASAFPNGTRFRLALAPDLSIKSVAAPASLFLGADSVVRTTLRNTGGADAAGATVTYKLSRDTLDDGCVGDPVADALRACDDMIIGTSSPAGVLAGQEATIETHLVLPNSASLTPGIYQLLSTVDARNTIAEVNDDDNAGPVQQVLISSAAPDYVVTSLLGGPTADVGGKYALTRSIKNQGNKTGHGQFVVVLSSNAQVSPADLVLEQKDNLTLAAGGVLTETVNLTIPANIAPGSYWIGLLVRPGEGEAELDPLNDDRAFGPITVRGDALAITSDEFPAVTVGVPFVLQLGANRPLGNTSWSAGFPAPPDGVQVSTDGIVSGVLAASGEWPLQVQVSSAGSVASRTFHLRATGGTAPLALVTTRLPTAQTAVPYGASLVAIGGSPPYSWSLVAPSALPTGLSIGTDGTLEGLPLVEGSQSFRVRVTDAHAATAESEVVLPVAGPTRPMFVTETLPSAQLGTPYSQSLSAVGGTRPYQLTLIETRLLPAAPGDREKSTPGIAPPGLTLSTDGVLTGTPSIAGTYLITVNLLDAQRFDTTATWLLQISDGSAPAFVVTTRTLPDAIVGESYDAVFSTSGASGDVTWEAVFMSGVELPAGLSVSETGHLFGTPSTIGTASFLAVARDTAGHRAVRALGVRVVEAPTAAAKSSGCSAFDASAFALLGLVALLRKRKLLLGVACIAGLLACTSAPKKPCASGCPTGLTCDETDDICKCGGHGGAVCGAGETCDAALRSCTAPSCDSGCPSGTVCGADGSCHCGNVSGEVCADGKECGEAGRCVTRDVCAGVRCSAGMTCDSTQQGACRCGPGGPACASGERCRNGACVADLCVGVSCAGGTSCDPTDGQCRCGGRGGAMCLLGEACDVVSSSCVPSTTCAGITCGAGEACDPVDGLCRCAGPGGPRCTSDQWCDPKAKQCLGGDRCASVTCSGGLSCDPEDGVCKCGGFGGVECTTAERCVVSGARTMCVVQCDPLGQPDCGEGRECSFDELAGLAYCQQEGTSQASEACGPGHTCGPGLHCIGAYVNSPGHCVPYCKTDDECAAGFYCKSFNGDTYLGVCALIPTNP